MIRAAHTPHGALAELLADADVPHATAAARALALAMEWCQAALAPDALAGRANILRALRELARASERGGSLAALTSDLILRADPGEELTEVLARFRGDLAGAAERLKLLATVEAERDELERARAELQRREVLAQSRDELLAQVADLEATLPEGAAEAEGLEERLAAATERLASLAGVTLARLRATTRETLERAAAAELEVARARAELDAAAARHAELEPVLAVRAAALAAYARADSEVAHALAGHPSGGASEGIGAILDKVETLLGRADAALAAAAEARQIAQEDGARRLPL